MVNPGRRGVTQPPFPRSLREEKAAGRRGTALTALRQESAGSLAKQRDIL